MTPAAGDVYTFDGRAFRLLAHDHRGPDRISNWTAEIVTSHPGRTALKTIHVPTEADAAVLVGRGDMDWDAVTGATWRKRAERSYEEIVFLQKQLEESRQQIARHRWETRNMRLGVAKLKKLREFKRAFTKLANQYLSLSTPLPRKSRAKKTKAARKKRK